ncbi:DUF6975 family protein [Sphingomonas sp. RS2018]
MPIYAVPTGGLPARHQQRVAALDALVATDGSASQAYVAALIAGRPALRDLNDAVHCLCMLHGRHPGVVDHATTHEADEAAKTWLETVATAFAEERTALVGLVAAAGPLPSTPGQAESEAAIVAQCHAMDMIGRSDRAGCALGAALALALDWQVIRPVLDTLAERLGRPLPPLDLPDVIAGITTAVPDDAPAGFDRALLFGAQQVLAQHRALWQLLEARAKARDAI